MSVDRAKTSEKEKKQWVITSILLVIFVISFTKNVVLRKKGVTAPSAQTASGPIDGTQNLADDLLFVTNYRMKDKQFAEQTKVWEKEWGRDPFISQDFGATVVRAVNLTLNGILWDDANPKAIVNEKVVHKGDTIYGYTVMDVKQRSVILRTGEKNVELSVFRPIAADTK